MKRFDRFCSIGCDPGRWIVILNHERFEVLPDVVKTVLMEAFGFSECSEDEFEQITEAIRQEFER